MTSRFSLVSLRSQSCTALLALGLLFSAAPAQSLARDGSETFAHMVFRYREVISPNAFLWGFIRDAMTQNPVGEPENPEWTARMEGKLRQVAHGAKIANNLKSVLESYDIRRKPLFSAWLARNQAYLEITQAEMQKALDGEDKSQAWQKLLASPEFARVYMGMQLEQHREFALRFSSEDNFHASKVQSELLVAYLQLSHLAGLTDPAASDVALPESEQQVRQSLEIAAASLGAMDRYQKKTGFDIFGTDPVEAVPLVTTTWLFSRDAVWLHRQLEQALTLKGEARKQFLSDLSVLYIKHHHCIWTVKTSACNAISEL